MHQKDFYNKHNKTEPHKLNVIEYLQDVASLLQEMQPLTHLNSFYDGIEAVVDVDTGEIVFKPVKALKALIEAKPKACIDTGKPLFWEVEAQRMNAEYANTIKAKAISASTLKRGAKPKIVQNKVKGDIECFDSVNEWVDAQPAVDNILFGATHLSTKTEWNEFDKPINTGLVFSVLKECDTINTTDTMELTGLSKSQAERINAVVRVVNTQYSNCRVI